MAYAFKSSSVNYRQESRAVARKPRDVACYLPHPVLSHLEFCEFGWSSCSRSGLICHLCISPCSSCWLLRPR